MGKPEHHTEYGKQSLRDHVIDKAADARQAYGPDIDYEAVKCLLKDCRFVRYPVRVDFTAEPLQPGEFAYAMPLGGHPREGFSLCVHPHYEHHTDVLPLLIAYHLVSVNYGDIATHEEAELYGATLLGLPVEEYYRQLCELADAVSLSPKEPE